MLKEKAEKVKKIINPHNLVESALNSMIAKCNKNNHSFLHYRTNTPFMRLCGQDKQKRDIVEVRAIPIGHKTFQYKTVDVKEIENHWDGSFVGSYREGFYAKSLELLKPLTFVVENGKIQKTESTKKKIAAMKNGLRSNGKLKQLISEINDYPETDKIGYDYGMGLCIQKHVDKKALEEIGSLNMVLAAECGVVISFEEEENGRVHYHNISNISPEERDLLLPGSYVLDAVNCHFQFAINETLSQINLSKSSATVRKLIKLKTSDDMYASIIDFLSKKGDRDQLALSLCDEYKKGSEFTDLNSTFETLLSSGKLRKAVKQNISAMLNAKTKQDFHRRDRLIGSFLLLEHPVLYDELSKRTGNLDKQYRKYVSMERALMDDIRDVLNRDTYDEYDGLRFFGKLSHRDCQNLLSVSLKHCVKLKIEGMILSKKTIPSLVSSTTERTSEVLFSTTPNNPKPIEGGEVPYVSLEHTITRKTRETGVSKTLGGNIQGPIPTDITKPNSTKSNITKPKKENHMTKAYLEAVNPDEELDDFVKELRKEQAPVSKPLPKKAIEFLKKLEEEKQAKLLKLQQHLKHQQLHQLYEPQSTEQSTEQSVQHASEQNEKLSNASETNKIASPTSKTFTSPGEAPAGSKADIKPSDIKSSERSQWLLDEEKKKKEAYEAKRKNVLDIFDGILGS